MNLQLQNINDTLVLDDNFKYTVSPYRRRIGVQDRFGKHGGVPTGDRNVSARNISLSFNVAPESDDQAYKDILNELAGFFRADLAPFFLIDTDNLVRTQIENTNLSDSPFSPGLLFKIGNNKIDFKMVDAHWEDSTATIVQPTGGGIISNNEIFIVNNNSPIETYSIITLTALGNNFEFVLRNETTGAATLLGSTSFVSGTQFIINHQTGEILLDDSITQIENSIALADGFGFWFLTEGNNELKYESIWGAVNLEVEFRKKYAF